ncbi:MAG TPA: AAA family ATPase [Allosphingosinicella sp.]
MIFVAGVSSSGKTYMLRRLAERRPDIVVISGSQTLSSLGRPLRALTPEEALGNQWVLLAKLSARDLLAEARAILDGHAIIETTAGPMAIPETWYDAANFAGFVQVEAEPKTLAERRSSRGLPWTEREAGELQTLERRELLRHSTRLGRPYLAVRSDEVEVVEAWVDRVVSSPAADAGGH